MSLSERETLNLLSRALIASVRWNGPDLSARQQAILLIVSLEQGPHTVRGLAERLAIAKPAVTRALDTLAGLDFVRRVPDETDLRSVFVERTRDGAAYLRSLAGELGRESLATTHGPAPSTPDAEAA